jgi:osmotically inducible protein OsmC
MALTASLMEQQYLPGRIETIAKVHLVKTEDGFRIPKIELATEADVPGIDRHSFEKLATDAKNNCPLANLSAAEITIHATLLIGQEA